MPVPPPEPGPLPFVPSVPLPPPEPGAPGIFAMADQGRIRDLVTGAGLEDPRIRVVHHPKNRGYGGALLSGFAAATRTWVFYTDGDAQYDPAEMEAALVVAKAERIEDDGARVGERFGRHDVHS